MGQQSVRVEENSDFQQIVLPLVELGFGEHVLQSTRLEADSTLGAWYELYLVVTPSGFLIEKHSGSARGLSRQKETWFRRRLADAEHKYSQILNSKLNQKRRSPRKYKVVENDR
ncbi:MAG: hypothetical protein WCL71_10570 [Deltaproteobacteria bacterium]